MTTATRHDTTPATRSADWRTRAACQNLDIDTIYSDERGDQAEVQAACLRCPVRTLCLADATRWEEGPYQPWGVAGGLTHLQRQALRVHALLGEHPDLKQAGMLVLPQTFGDLLWKLRDWSLAAVVTEFRGQGVTASAVTIRVAMWWLGCRAALVAQPWSGDGRLMSVQIHDDHQQLVQKLTAMGVSRTNIALHLGVSPEQVQAARQAWKRAAERAGQELAA
ncbi:WhiB family transcriptional regulator (plasmid) [Streptomyces seoulensis]|uniref:WhiB family transcriptional regulator n=1 Tax=Streptomyces seoulensis TaxID=73044 RepID=A0A4P6U3G0_STRSO|nr:WhiB family transcriptional regulator [Streptomyces seoulensis]QBJ94480.1 WhiB family transcriptional regulator [Streptomyces seoulensis]